MQKTQVIVQALDKFHEAKSVAQKWRIVGPVERKLQRALRKAFEAQGKLFAKHFGTLRPLFSESSGPWWRRPRLQLRETITADDWLRIWDLVTGETFDLFFEPIQAAAQNALRLGATATIAEIGVDIAFTLANPRAVTYLERHGFGLISQINEVTRGNIATIVTNGVDEGWSYNRIAREIIGLYREMAVGRPQEHIESRAHLIAVTEAGNAYEEGSAIVVRDLQDSGLRMEKKWLTVGDNRVSNECRENQAEGWIPVSQPFRSGHMRPLRFPGCRCTVLYQRARG